MDQSAPLIAPEPLPKPAHMHVHHIRHHFLCSQGNLSSPYSPSVRKVTVTTPSVRFRQNQP